MKIEFSKHKKKLFILILILLIFVSYYKSLSNYFFSDDFEWISRAIVSQAEPLRAFKVYGRDFNPVFIIILSILIKIFGVSAFPIRLFFLSLFAITFAFLFHTLEKRLNFSQITAFSATFLVALNVYISEAALNLAASVYFLAFFLFLISFNYLSEKKIYLFFILFTLAFLTKEMIILTLIPVFIFSEKKIKKQILIFGASLLTLRFIIQFSTTSQYTSFVSKKLFLAKLYFILLRSINLSPYKINPIYGLFLLTSIILLILIYMVKFGGEKDKTVVCIFVFWILYTIFFAFLPKLSSRYILYPSIGFILIYLKIFDAFSKYKIIRFALTLLLVLSFVYNYPKIGKEIEDYKILGDFSKNFLIKIKTEFVKNIDPKRKEQTIKIKKPEKTALIFTYAMVKRRGNLPKLLPMRKNSLGGVIYLKDLIPITFYPERIAIFKPKKITQTHFIGQILFLK